MVLQSQRAGGIQPVECLVQDNQLRLTEQRQQDGEFLPRPQRVGIHEPVEHGQILKTLSELQHVGID